jgi:pyrroloquinoline quinone biosynthesis protein D
VSKPRLAARARLRWDRIDGRYLLLYPERGLALNESAAAILQLCDGSRTIDDIVTELVAMSRLDHDAAKGRAAGRRLTDGHAIDPGATRGTTDESTVRRDVTAFLDEMRRRGLIEPADGPQDPSPR